MTAFFAFDLDQGIFWISEAHSGFVSMFRRQGEPNATTNAFCPLAISYVSTVTGALKIFEQEATS